MRRCQGVFKHRKLDGALANYIYAHISASKKLYNWCIGSPCDTLSLGVHFDHPRSLTSSSSPCLCPNIIKASFHVGCAVASPVTANTPQNLSAYPQVAHDFLIHACMYVSIHKRTFSIMHSHAHNYFVTNVTISIAYMCAYT
jgi:hypothetical protein